DIRSRAGAAVERLGEVIGVLREPSETAPASEPGAGAAGLAGLVDRAREAGLDVRLRVEGEPAADDVPRAVERALHRVVQEALTNVVKHAPADRATVVVRHAQHRTEVAVTNAPVRTAPSAPGPGRPGPGPAPAPVSAPVAAPGEAHRFGLIGLDERVRLAGGTFASGPEVGNDQSPAGGHGARATAPGTARHGRSSSTRSFSASLSPYATTVAAAASAAAARPGTSRRRRALQPTRTSSRPRSSRVPSLAASRTVPAHAGPSATLPASAR
ncbi:sensor histidine kinase, partial [Streptomyces sp. NPDC059949]|uniref:sensor histidine kinase n=1 Tax=Streptomyces sp. NPDC059949 TaxID=3347013 RepID=UPI00364E72F4